MKQIHITIKAASPLAIGRQKPGGSVSEAESFIPGTVLRGALAARLLEGQNRQDLRSGQTDFRQLFLEEGSAIFRNAYPVESGELRSIEPGKREVKLLPATAVSSKNDSGFKTAEKPKRCGVFDTLIDRFCAESHNHPYDPSSPQDHEDRIDLQSGYYSIVGGRYLSATAPKRLLTRVGINRRRSTAEEGLLYSLEVLSESNAKGDPSFFVGSVMVKDDALANRLTNALKTADLRLGGATSRGLGQVYIDAVCDKVTNGVEGRIQRFNETLKKQWKLWDIFGSQPLTQKQKFFTLDLQSEAILSEQWRRSIVISEVMLQAATGVEDPTLQLHVAYASSGFRSGWNAAWGLMKDTELVTTAGAVYLYSTEHPERWYSALQTLEHLGIGERTSEGFGQLRICDEFHLVLREEAK